MPATDAASRSASLGLYALDAIALSPAWTLTLSARHDRTRTVIDDRSGTAPELNGRHTFARLNPAAGLDWHPGPAWTAFASVSQGFRAPTPMELTCADPGAPCKLPTGFVSDPPLQAVVARTLEAGARGQPGAWQWSVAAWRTQVQDDIQFVASETASAGYFRNVGATRRQGLELGARAVLGRLTAALRMARVDARFEAGFVEHSPFHPRADAQGLVTVPAGARLPGIARDSAKLRLDWKASDRWSWGASLSATSASLVRGDESNQAGAKVAGHGLIDLDARWRVGEGVTLELQLHNLLDRRYATAGVLGRNAFTGPSRAFDGANGRNELFVAPGAPFAAWLGLEIRWQ
jgi:outer membrane receptor protein involved in Fe transport